MEIYFYLLLIEGDTEPTVEGPFVSSEERNEAAREYRRSEFEGGIFPLNVSAEAEPIVEIEAFTNAFFDDEEGQYATN